MRRFFRRISAATLSVAVLASVVPQMAIAVNNADNLESNINAETSDALDLMSVAEDFSWDLTDGVLTIDGNGAMPDCSYSSAPWNSQANEVTKIIIKDGITSIPQGSFATCYSVSEIEIPFVGTSADDENGYIGSIFGVSRTDYLMFTGRCPNLRSVTITGGTEIPYNAFYGSKQLTQIVLPDSLEKIGGSAFSLCESLTDIVIPDGVTEVGSDVFSHCYGITQIIPMNGINYIPYGTYRDCTGLTKLDYPDSVTEIYPYAFAGCSNITDINLSGNVKTISAGAFRYCTGLTDVTIPDSVEFIGDSAFEGCSNINKIEIPFVGTSADDENGYIGSMFGYKKYNDYSAFVSNYSKLKSVTLTGGTSLPDYSFYGCSQLTEIILPDSLKSIGESAFLNCEGLTNFIIPENVSTVEGFTLANCKSIESITIPASLKNIYWADFFGCEKLKSVHINDGVMNIGYAAFRCCYELSDIYIPNTVTNIGNLAFDKCTSLTEIAIPRSVESIEDEAFSNCTNLENVILYDSVIRIGKDVFSNCKEGFYLSVMPDSYAEEYAKENEIAYQYIGLGHIIKLALNSHSAIPITEGYNINWYNNDGQIIGAGNRLYNAEEGEEYQYKIILGEELSKNYYQPAPQKIIATDEDIEISITLELINDITVSGNVTNSEGDPIDGARVILKQTFNDTYKSEIEVYTDKAGAYSVEGKNVPSTITVTAHGYYSRTKSVSGVDDELKADFPMINLPEDKITLTLSLQSAAKEYEQPSVTTMTSGNNLSFKLYNKTQNKEILGFTFEYPYIILDEGEAKEGDTIEITALDNKREMTADITNTTVDENRMGTASIKFVQNGSIEIASLKGNEYNTVMIFDKNDNFVKSEVANLNYKTGQLAEGEYTLLFIGKSNLLRTISNISKLSEYGLTENKDYITVKASVSNGVITEISEITVPVLDESKLYYTVPNVTKFTATTQSVSVGRYLSMRAEYEIDSKYQVSNQVVSFEIPEGISFTDGSLTLDGKAAQYSINGRTVTINTNRSKGIIRFYVVATEAGKYNITASLGFFGDSGNVLQPIGTASFEATSAKISVPAKIGKTNVTVTGTTLAESNVTVYDNGTKVAETTSNKAGNWSADINLVKPYDYSSHNIYAEIENSRLESVIRTDIEKIIYDKNYMYPTQLTMINTAHGPSSLALVEYKTVIDFQSGDKALSPYWYWPEYPHFTFKAEFSGGTDDSISNVYVVTTDSGGDSTYVPLTYDSITDTWIGTHEYTSSQQVPQQVGIIYDVDGGITYPTDWYTMVNSISAEDTDNVRFEVIDDTETHLQGKIYLDDICLPITMERSSGNREDSDIEQYISDGYETLLDIGSIVMLYSDDKNVAVEYKFSDTNTISKTEFDVNDLSNNESIQTFSLMSTKEMPAALCMDDGLTPQQIIQLARDVSEYFDGPEDIQGITMREHLRQQKNIDIIMRAGVIAVTASFATPGAHAGGPVEEMVDTVYSINDSRSTIRDFDEGMQSLTSAQMGWYRSMINHLRSYGFLTTGCGDNEHEPPKAQPDTTVQTPVIYDPSGYVCEAVPSNRLEGVKAETYYYDYALDEFGIPEDEKSDILWDAENYNQVNPLYTDINGMYAWDVPVGQWLVKFTKDGYFETDSKNDPNSDNGGYLHVPPPQTEVNVSMISKSAPQVKSINAYETGIRIEFSQYMDIDSVNTDNVVVSMNGTFVRGTITPVNNERSFNDASVEYASIFVFIPDSELSDKVSVNINGVRNYASTAMENTYTVNTSVEYEPKGLEVTENLNISYNDGALITVKILPEAAGANKAISVKSTSPSIASADETVITTNKKGEARVRVSGNLPGSGEILFSLDGTDISAMSEVTVENVQPQSEQTCKKVTASIEHNSIVAKGTTVTLATETEGAEIFYTLDKTCPCITDNPARTKYTEPIEINDDMYIIAYAVKDGYEDSATAGFAYKVEGDKVIPVKILDATVGNTLIVAQYGDNGNLLDIKTKTAQETTETIEIKYLDETEYIKIMEWNSLSGMKPTRQSSPVVPYTATSLTPGNTVIVAVYDSKSALLSCATMLADDETETVCVGYNSDASYIRIMEWDSLMGLNPVREAVTQSVK